ncbi:MAG TPA: YibE/F family protein [Clostridiales bacterium]|nr:YibE/F family protein [Clostridiales bacterium]
MRLVKKYIKNNQLKVAILGVMLIGFMVALFFVKNDYFLYNETIVSVIEVSETEFYGFNAETPSNLQKATAIIRNGEHKDEIIEFENVQMYSRALGYDISKGNDLIVQLNDDLTVRSIDSVKRDFYVALQLGIFCLLLFAIASKQSLFILLAALINMGLFVLIVYLRSQLYNLFFLFIIGTILFTIITLFLISGFNKKTIGAILSTLTSVAMMMTIAVIVFKIFNNNFYYETIEFLDYIFDYKNVLYSSILISGLGAIMDITIIISTSINELISKNPEISTKELKSSAWAIGQDITGTIMNVLFFSCIVGALPSILLLISNGMPMMFILEYYGSAEVIRALVGCIGIVLAVPISYLINISLRRRWQA